jgi:ribonuclease D
MAKMNRLYYDFASRTSTRLSNQATEVQHQYISTREELSQFCDAIANSPAIGFDTEFVSEDCYRPHLCLIQVATPDHIAVIDTIQIEDTREFWQLLASGDQITIAHAAREELRFCLHSVEQRPNDLFDIQIAAGLVGYEYPAAYGTLVDRLLRKSVQKGETRTNWRARPLSSRQIEYALQDVEHLLSLHARLLKKLSKLDRLDWMRTEMERWQQQVEHSDGSERWRRMSGISGLSERHLAIVRELWKWRENEAASRDIPAKRVLRDDLIVELAKRKTADPARIKSVRGLERSGLRRHLPDISERIKQGLDLPNDQLPANARKSPSTPQVTLLGQFLNTALGSICRAAQVAPSIVGTAQDVRDLIAYRLDLNGAAQATPPSLAVGWRAEVVGHVIEELLSGKLSIRITDPHSDRPLSFEANESDD